MRSKDLHDLVVVGDSRAQVCGGREVACVALALRERLVGDVPHEVLQEAVLPVLRRARVRLERDHLFAHER